MLLSFLPTQGFSLDKEVVDVDRNDLWTAITYDGYSYVKNVLIFYRPDLQYWLFTENQLVKVSSRFWFTAKIGSNKSDVGSSVVVNLWKQLYCKKMDENVCIQM